MATVRIDPTTHARLQTLSEAEKRPMSQIIEDAVNRYQRDTFWQAMHAGFARLRADPAAWGDYQAEMASWVAVSGRERSRQR